MEKELFCCLCDRQYSELNLPRLFPACGHTYCENCIKNLMGLNRQRQIRIICPQDHIEMRFEDRDINHFPKNISLVKLMAAAHANRKRSSQTARDESLLNDIHEDDVEQHSPHSQRNDNNNKSRLNSSISVKSKSVVSQDTLNEQQICLIHQKALEIVCIQHRTLICSNCAIFGQHKGHDFKSVRDMEKDKMDKQKGILQLIDRKEAIISKEMSKERHDEQSKFVHLKKELLMQQIKLKYSKLYDLVKFSERKSVEKLHKYFTVLEEKLRTQNNEVQKVMGTYKQWEEKAMKEVDSFERGINHLEEQIAYLGYEGQLYQSDILDEGNQIISNLESEIKSSNHVFDETIEGVQMIVNEDVERGLSDYVTFREKKVNVQRSSPTTRKPSTPSILSSQSILSVPSLREFRQLLDLDVGTAERKTSHPVIPESINETPIEEMLLETSRPKNSNALNLNRTKSPENMVQVLSTPLAPPTPTKYAHGKRPSNFEKIVMPEPPPIDREAHYLKDMSSGSPKACLRSTFSSPRSKQFLMMNSALSGMESPKKKLKIKLPEKYDKMLEAIIFETTDTGDFTGAELGNQTIMQILEVIRGKKIKCLKLIRNKLTDDILDALWPMVSGISVLNLSQNYFTDRAIQSFIGNMSKVPQLKNLVLSQNKINARNNKGRIEELKRFDITISL